ncbi:MAG: hypothetical protein WKF37_16730 [Bryobacteraceae bacterium]
MVIVVALMGLIAAISFPSVSSGLDSIRLTTATDSIVSFLNGGLNRAQRRQQPIEITISVAENYLSMQSVEPGFVRRLELPEGVKVLRIHPEIAEESARSFVLYPAGAIPRFGVEITNHRGVRRIVRVDPITGVPQVENVEP